MSVFIHENFLLTNKFAQTLYHDYAENLPILDFHCHLNPAEIAADQRWENISELWLSADHYKWRQLRTNGVAEKYCTGDASAWEKFYAYASSMPDFLRNPLYHWTHLELKKYFGISDLLNAETARKIYDECNRIIKRDDFSARALMLKSNVQLVCTTDDPIDDLRHHQKIAADNFAVKVLPTWRPDKAMAIEQASFTEWTNKLSAAAKQPIKNFADFIAALRIRHHYFHQHGCRLSDHGIETFYAKNYTLSEIEEIFQRGLNGEKIPFNERLQFRSAMLYELAKMNHEKSWTQQFHYGVMRNNNPAMFAKIGADTGFDSLGDLNVGRAMADFFGRLANNDQLTKTIIYNANPRDNELIATMLGTFQDGVIAGKMQMGSAWWFLDQLDGMTRQIEAISQLSLLRRFVGMVTDSRSFLSYPRHEYFRRLLCELLGKEMENGRLPNDLSLVGKIVTAVCYDNAREYLGVMTT